MSERTPFNLDDPSASRRIAEAMIGRAPQDLIFVMRFLGQSQEMLHSHFCAFLEAALARAGATRDTHPLLPYFIDAHALELRDFVFTGVSLSRQFRLREIETLTGDAETVMRVDIWDALANHIESAEAKFVSDIGSVVSALDDQERQMRGGGAK